MKVLRLASASVLAASATLAGGIDQSGQPVTLIFGDGNHAEVSFGYWMPDIRGTGPAGNESGNVYGDLRDLGGGFRKQFNDQWSAALIVDQPYGVIVDYDSDLPTGPFDFAGTSARPESLGVTALVRYRIDDRFSVHGGLRATRLGAELDLAGTGFDPLLLNGYSYEGADDWGLGYVLGGAYEIPQIALRVALTYASATELELDSTEENVPVAFDAVHSTTDITMPQSVNLDFQTGVAAKTLVYGSVRWANWEGWDLSPAGFMAFSEAFGDGRPLLEFEHDTLHYKLGVGHQFTGAWSAALEVVHETATDELQSALTPYDGLTAFTVGAGYRTPAGVTVTGGVQYAFLGDAEVPIPGQGEARFHDNHAVGLGVTLGYDF